MKFINKKCDYDGHKFDSKKEMEYYIHLLSKYDKESITVHPKFVLLDPFEVHGEKLRAITYTADFQVGNIVIDVKNSSTFLTPEFRLKFKLAKNKFRALLFMITWKQKGKWESK